MRIRSLTSLAMLGLAAGCVRTMRPPAPFMERIYAARVPSDTSLMYEAQVATHILFVDGLPNAYATISRDEAAHSADALRVFVTPMFRIRQLNDSSAAVRTPSFIPRLSAEWLRVYRVGTVTSVKRDSAAASTSTPFGSRTVSATSLPTAQAIAFPATLLTGARLTLTHHSNGQAGCFRNGFVPTTQSPFTCVPERDALGRVKDTTTVSLNRANGDFSSTFVNLMVHVTLMNRGDDNQPGHSVGAMIGYDRQFHDPVPGALTSEQRQLYGEWRVHGMAEGMQRFGRTCADTSHHGWDKAACLFAGRTRVSVEGERAPRLDTDLARRISPAVVPYRYSVELSHALDFALGAGAFVRWHRGQDYYNIGFVRERNFFMWGLMLDMSGLDCIGQGMCR